MADLDPEWSEWAWSLAEAERESFQAIELILSEWDHTKPETWHPQHERDMLRDLASIVDNYRRPRAAREQAAKLGLRVMAAAAEFGPDRFGIAERAARARIPYRPPPPTSIPGPGVPRSHG